MPRFDRREWLAGCAAALVPSLSRAAVEPPIRLGFSLYGMKALKPVEAVDTCAKIGYRCVELSLMPTWPTEPARLSAADRKELRGRLVDANVSLAALMENLSEPAADAVHMANLDRLKAAAELGRDLSPDAVPVIETVLGGKPADWEKVKELMAQRLTAWAEVGKDAKTVIAVKAHIDNALQTPEQALWLLRRVDSPWLRLAYDQSHFELQGIRLEDSAAALLPESVFVHVKDAKGKPPKFEFLLPGAGDTDYREYARILRKAAYKGPVVVEVSGQVFNKPGYDPVAAAKACYAKLAPAFADAGRAP